MSGFHTPAKKQTPSASPSQATPPDVMPNTSPTERTATQTNVRRSVGEWEASKGPSTISAPAAPMKPKKLKTTIPLSLPTAQKDLVGVADSPTATTTKTTSRTQEARNWVTKAKTAMKESRNLKTEIKAVVTQAIDSLFQLVKEAELEKGLNTSDGKNLQKKDPQNKKENKIETSANEEYSHLLSSLADHSELMRESGKRMRELKEALVSKSEATTYAAVVARAKPSPVQPALQSANLQRKELATAELLGVAEERKVAIALIQEPYVGSIRRMRDYRGVRIFQAPDDGSGTVKAAIAVFEQDLDVIQCPELTTHNTVVVRIRTRAWDLTVVSVYYEPDKPIDGYLERLREIRRKLGSRGLLIGGDVNAKSSWWGSNTEDKRGEELCGTLEELDLQVLNSGNVPTFYTIRGGKTFSSHVDLTVCSADLIGLVEGWRVDVGMTSSDHNGIVFNIRQTKSSGINIKTTTRLYNTKKANWSQFREKLSQLKIDNKINNQEIQKIKNKTELEKVVESYLDVIKNVSEDPAFVSERQHLFLFTSQTYASYCCFILRLLKEIG
ncbi:unnamed protein product [Arctia plantaginis]|uniref:Endonuclease/exonuclease/phosphatase domain-containing protein n=1 Tax=Arctia plantaginis TaxID=874455 RepID=A0A8S1B2U2_ARCPL|nr:unnamed protein product [Arctia plantaginis]